MYGIKSNLIRKKVFTSAQPHDSQLFEDFLSVDERAIFGDSAYSKKEDEQEARKKKQFRLMQNLLIFLKINKILL